jgi:hypothetical protein
MSSYSISPPIIQNIADLSKKDIQDQIENFVNENPFVEHIYTLKSVTDARTYNPTTHLLFNQQKQSKNICVAGSSALYRLIKMMSPTNKTTLVSWNPNDNDIFLLNSQNNCRSPKCLGSSLDIIHSTAKTPEALISDFDLPCCRVAFDFNMNFYISIHALNAILTKIVYMPSYMSSWMSFLSNIKSIGTEYLEKKFTMNHTEIVNRIQKTKYSKYLSRLDKYEDRGFIFKFVNTSKILPWMHHDMKYYTDQNVSVSDVLPPTPSSIGVAIPPICDPNPIMIIRKIPIIDNNHNLDKPSEPISSEAKYEPNSEAKYDPILVDKIKELTGRDNLAIYPTLMKLQKEKDIHTLKDLSLLDDTFQIFDIIESEPMKQALNIIWKQHHENFVNLLTKNNKDITSCYDYINSAHLTHLTHLTHSTDLAHSTHPTDSTDSTLEPRLNDDDNTVVVIKHI